MEKLVRAAGETQIQVGRIREAVVPTQGRRDGPPPKNRGGDAEEEETLQQPIPRLHWLASDSQPLSPRDNDPRISEKVRGNVGGQRERFSFKRGTETEKVFAKR